jgi:hypothetical protein
MRPDPWIIINDKNPNVTTQISLDPHPLLYLDVDIESHTSWISLIIKAMRPDPLIIIMREIQM